MKNTSQFTVRERIMYSLFILQMLALYSAVTHSPEDSLFFTRSTRQGADCAGAHTWLVALFVVAQLHRANVITLFSAVFSFFIILFFYVGV